MMTTLLAWRAGNLWYQIDMPESASQTPVKILFVCVGNSCRSQMAEAFANKLGGGRVVASSAGSHALGEIVSPTETVMSEKGISLEGHWSKSIKDVAVGDMDIVVGMGCEVECPVPAGFKGQQIEWNIPDPYGHELTFYRSVRDLIERQVRALLDEIEAQREIAQGEGEAS
jgi:protein-tyrosine-phosphatase